jgi:hypothetical protein
MFQFDRICAENNIIPLFMPSHSSNLLQPLDVDCFTVIKRAHGRFVSDLAHTAYSRIDKCDFLVNYQHARVEEAFQVPSIIQDSFAATGLVSVDAERVLPKLISLYERRHHQTAGQATDQANSHQKRLEQ